MEYYWGAITSTIDWCEENYKITIYIAEFWNTISNLIIIGLSLYGLKNSLNNNIDYIFSIQYISILFVGLGSSLFHCTLRYTEQQLDEIPMMMGLFIWIYIIYKKEWIKYLILQKYLYLILFTVCILYTILHIKYNFTTIFQLTFGILVLFTAYKVYIYYKQIDNNELKKIVRIYYYSIILATFCWLIDYHYCNLINKLSFNLQFHAWWHIFSGINSYIGPVFMQYIRAKDNNQNPEIEYNYFNIPIIVIKN